LANAGEPWLDYSDLGSRYSLYRTADRRVALVAPSERRFWERFVDLVALPDYAHERVAIAERLATRTLDEWAPLFAEAEVPFAPILTLEEAMASEHAAVNAVM